MMTRPMLALALSVVVLAGCRSPAGPGQVLVAARARWAETGIRDYSITVQRICECTPEQAGPVVVEVRDGVAVSRTYASSGAAVDAGAASRFPTIERLFEILDEAARNRTPRVDATYDSQLGYPTYVAVDPDRLVADDESIYSVTDFLER